MLLKCCVVTSCVSLYFCICASLWEQAEVLFFIFPEFVLCSYESFLSIIVLWSSSNLAFNIFSEHVWILVMYVMVTVFIWRGPGQSVYAWGMKTHQKKFYTSTNALVLSPAFILKWSFTQASNSCCFAGWNLKMKAKMILQRIVWLGRGSTLINPG